MVGGCHDHRPVAHRVRIGDCANFDAARSHVNSDVAHGSSSRGMVNVTSVVARQTLRSSAAVAATGWRGDALHPVVHGRVGNSGGGLGKELKLRDGDVLGTVVGVGNCDGQIVADLQYGSEISVISRVLSSARCSPRLRCRR